MNWTKPNFTQWIAIITTVAAFAGYVWHGENERIDAKIRQHDLEQQVDSIGKAFAIFTAEFKDLRKAREVTTIQRDKEKKEDDERTEKLDIRLTILETTWRDFEFYKLKK